MIDDKTKQAIKNIIKNSERSAAKAFIAFKNAVNENPIDRDKIDQLYSEWKMYDDYLSTEATMLTMLEDGVGFDE